MDSKQTHQGKLNVYVVFALCSQPWLIRGVSLRNLILYSKYFTGTDYAVHCLREKRTFFVLPPPATGVRNFSEPSPRFGTDGHANHFIDCRELLA